MDECAHMDGWRPKPNTQPNTPTEVADGLLTSSQSMMKMRGGNSKASSVLRCYSEPSLPGFRLTERADGNHEQPTGASPIRVMVLTPPCAHQRDRAVQWNS